MPSKKASSARCWVCGHKVKKDLGLSYAGQAGRYWLCLDEQACVRRRMKQPRFKDQEPEPMPGSGKRDQARRFN